MAGAGRKRGSLLRGQFEGQRPWAEGSNGESGFATAIPVDNSRIVRIRTEVRCSNTMIVVAESLRQR